MKRWRCKSIILLLLALVFVIACTRAKVGDQSGTINSIKLTSPLTSTEVGVVSTNPTDWEQKLQSLLEASQRESIVVVYSSIGADLRSAVISGFKAKYGLNVELVSGRGAETVMKLISQRKAGLYLADVYLGGASTIVTSLKPIGALDKLDTTLILPELTELREIEKVWWRGELLWVDRDHYILAFLAAPAPPVVINNELVQREEIKSFRDFLAPKWKGKITLNDPTTPGFGQMWFAAAAAQILGLDYMKELAKQEPLIMRDLRLQVEWLAHGKYPIAIAPQSDVVAEFMKMGASMESIIPIEGVHLSSGLGNLALINKAPHPNAAKLFINWLLSKEGQTIYSEELLYPSVRMDIRRDKIPSIKIPRPGAKYFMADEESFLLDVKPKMDEFAKEIFGPLNK